MKGAQFALDVARNEIRIIAKTPVYVITTFVMPLILAIFLEPTMTTVLTSLNGTATDGSVQAFPGMALFFSWYTASAIATSFHREQGWNTWSRLVSSGMPRLSIVLGKIIPWAAVAMAQAAGLGALGWLFFDMPAPGGVASSFALAGAWLCWIMAVCASGLLLSVLLSSTQAVAALSNILGLVLALLGGAIVPTSQLPGALEPASSLVPSSWLMTATAELLGPSDPTVSSVAAPVLLLIPVAAVLLIVAFNKFDRLPEKHYWI